jgi:hypothetical protein
LPVAISAESEPINNETFPGWAKVTYEFPEREGLPACKVTWYEGKNDGKRVLPDISLLQGTAKDYSGSGSLIIGENATMYSPDDYGSTRLLMGPAAKDLQRFEPKLPRRSAEIDLEMKKEWVDAIRRNNPKVAMSNFDYAATLTEAILLGNVAIVAGKKLTYDGKAGTFNDSEANKLLKREYRTGWKL